MFIPVAAVNCICVGQLLNLIGSGSLALVIMVLVGGASDTVWLTSMVGILTVVPSPSVSQAADYWGRKWFLAGLSTIGCAGYIIVSHAESMAMVVAGLTVSGLSYGYQPLIHAVASEVLPRKYRSYAKPLRPSLREHT